MMSDKWFYWLIAAAGMFNLLLANIDGDDAFYPTAALSLILAMMLRKRPR